jgi:hypothetical protein
MRGTPWSAGAERWRAAVVVAALLAGLASPASAQWETPEPSQMCGAVRVDGEAVAHEVSVLVERTASSGFPRYHVWSRLLLEAGPDGAAVHVRARGPDARLEVDGQVVPGPTVVLEPGQRAVVVARHEDWWETPGQRLLFPALELRHFVFGEPWRFHRQHRSTTILPVCGRALEMDGAARVDVRGFPGMRVHVNRARVDTWPHVTDRLPRIELSRTHEPESLANGGPAVLLGGRMSTDGLASDFVLGVGYEVGLVEHLILSVWFETDIDSISEALVLEVASPALFILPAVSAGVGVVATQLGPRGADGGLRLKASLFSFLLSFAATFDYYFASGGWNITLGGQIGI